MGKDLEAPMWLFVTFIEDEELTELDNCKAQYQTNKAPVNGVWPQYCWIFPFLKLGKGSF